MDDLLQIVHEDGTYDASLDPGLPADELLKLYRMLVFTRTFDTRMLSLQRQGRIGFYVPSLGEEAVQVGSAAAMGPDDWVFPAYREPGAALMRGVPLATLVAQLYGNAEDILHGRQMPNHFSSKAHNFVTPSSPVGTQIPIAMGTAWAMQVRKEPKAALVYFGDGSTSQGDFHVAMNFAGVFRVPLVFMCKNNQWAISMPVSRQTAAATLASKASAYGFEGVRVDGNDVLAVYAATKKAAEKAHTDGGPTLIEALTYRMGPHSSSDDPARYRDPQEVERWKRRDPIDRFRRYLESKGLLDAAGIEAVRKEVDEAITEAVHHAEKVPQPPPESLFRDVYADMPPHLREQMEQFLKAGHRRRPEEIGEFPL